MYRFYCSTTWWSHMAEVVLHGTEIRKETFAEGLARELEMAVR